MANIFNLFQRSYSGSLDKTFLQLVDGREITYREIDELVSAYAGALASLGILAGERVMVQVAKSPEAIALYLATLKIGAVFVPLNTAYTPSELSHFIEDAEPRVFVCDTFNYEKTTQIDTIEPLRTEILTLGDLKHKKSLETLAERSGPYNTVKERSDDDLAAFLYTSGTTGRSKGAMLSHANLSSNALTLHKYWAFEPDDVLLHTLPIFHVHGLFVALHCALLNPSTVHFHIKYDAAEIVRDLEFCTVMMGVPAFYTRLLEQPDFNESHCKNIRLFISGSAPMTPQVHKEWTKRTTHQILERYGMTEAGMITSNPYKGERIPGTVGYPLPDIAVRVTDDKGRELPHGGIGNIEVKGPNVFQGYWKMPEKTAGEFREDGYFITGDLGSMDQEGRISITGREKDLIITGGYNVYPKEIELLIDDLDDVQESAVIGLPHPDFGESVCSVVVLKPGKRPDKETILAALKNRLAKFKQPREVIFVDALPRNSMGKIQKNELRNEYANKLV